MSFTEKLKNFLGIKQITDADWDELTDILIEGDLGAALSDAIVDELKILCKKNNIVDGNKAKYLLKDVLLKYTKTEDIILSNNSCNVILLLGVNGVGKTTTAAKLANYWITKKNVNKCLFAACDTFRAAAIDQIKKHGENLGVRVVAHEHGSDAGAVLYDALSAAALGYELVIADTAGRMHTKQNLIKELVKLDKIVAAKTDNVNYKKLLVVDATTGQNALNQAEVFSEAVKIDGIILTKYDSSGKGGIVISIAKKTGIGTAFICKGESYDSIEPFIPSLFLDELIGL